MSDEVRRILGGTIEKIDKEGHKYVQNKLLIVGLWCIIGAVCNSESNNGETFVDLYWLL